MRVITIGDLHGKTCWNKIPFENFDKVVFIGDYIDGDNSTDELANLNQIIQLKIAHPDKYILLIGNHEIQYYWHSKNTLRKYNRILSKDFEGILKTHEHLFQVAYQLENYLWTHAGITNRWIQFAEERLPGFIERFESDPASALNDVFKSTQKEILFSVGKAKGGNETGGPLRADKSELNTGIPLKLKQIIGHYRVKGIETIKIAASEITFSDCLNSSEEWAVLDINTGIFSILR